MARIFTDQQKLEAAQRELSYRKRVFERRVAEGKMTREKADYEIEIMSAIADDYAKGAIKERLL